jgi:hypothetical protein
MNTKSKILYIYVDYILFIIMLSIIKVIQYRNSQNRCIYVAEIKFVINYKSIHNAKL